MKKFHLTPVLSACLYYLFLITSSAPSLAQTKVPGNGKGEKDDSTTIDKSETKTIAEVTKSCVKYPGLFSIYQDSLTGKAYLEISSDKIGQEFIHFFHVENSPLDAGWVKGSYGSRICD